MANMYTALKTNLIAAIKANAGVTALLANGADSIVQMFPDMMLAMPCLSYHVSSRQAETERGPRKNWVTTIEVTIHGPDPDVVDQIDAAFDDMLEAGELEDSVLTSADVTVSNFLEAAAVSSDLDPRHLARDKIVEMRTRTFACLINRPPE